MYVYNKLSVKYTRYFSAFFEKNYFECAKFCFSGLHSARNIQLLAYIL